MKRHHAISLALAPALLVSTVIYSPAYGQSNSDSWQYSGGVNLWGAGIKGTTQAGNKIDVGFSDILDNLDFTLMGTLEGRKGEWSWLADLLYLSMSLDNTADVATPAGGARVRADVGVDGWALGLAAGYSLSDTSKGRSDVIFGARYLDLETSLKFTAGTASKQVSETGGVWDGVIGFRGRINTQGNWYIPYYLDVGAGQSDLTWQVIAGAARQFNWGDLTFAYRHLEWELPSDIPIKEFSFSGPIIQAKWYF